MKEQLYNCAHLFILFYFLVGAIGGGGLEGEKEVCICMHVGIFEIFPYLYVLL